MVYGLDGVEAPPPSQHCVAALPHDMPYASMGEPPSDGAIQDAVSFRTPGAKATPVGTPGVVVNVIQAV